MTQREHYLKLRMDRETLHGKLVGVPGKISELRKEGAAAADEAMRLEILGDPAAAGKRAAIKGSQEEIRRLEAETADLEHRLRILGEVIDEIRVKADVELSAVHEKAFAKGVRAFVVALRAAVKAENDLVAILHEGERAFSEIDSRRCPLPQWGTLIVRDLSGSGILKPEIENFLERAKSQGHDVS